MLLAGSEVIASVIDEFVTTYPNANVRMLNGNAEDMLRYLRTGDVDVVIGLIRSSASEGLAHQALAENALCGRLPGMDTPWSIRPT